MQPTTEQDQARAMHLTGNSMVIEAGAGTGKTTTLVQLAEATPERRGRYVAFNKAIVVDAGNKMPENVIAKTAHSLAFGAMMKRPGGRAFKARLDGGRVRGDQIARQLGIDPFVIQYGDQAKVLQPGFIASLAQRAINVFCNTADLVPNYRHVPYVDGIDVPSAKGERTYANNDKLAKIVGDVLPTMWADLCDPGGTLPFKHDHYLKMWELDDPHIDADFIMFDEAQDASPVMLSIVEQQAEHAQLIFVGDSQQCQPSGTSVTVVQSAPKGNRHTGRTSTSYQQVPIEQVQAGDLVASFGVACSFLRRSGSRVLETTARPHDGELVTVTTTEGCMSSYTPDHRCVVRIEDALAGKWIVYLMRRGQSFRVGLVKGTYDSQLGDIGLPKRVATEGADAAWILSTHDTEADARLAEAVTAWSYGVPSLRFRQSMKTGMTQTELDEFWSKVGDLTAAAAVLLRAYHRSIAHPLCGPYRRLYRHRAQVMQACNLLDGMHVLPFTGALDAGGKRVARMRWSPIQVTRSWYSGTVYSLRVEGDETYVADGIVTHNSIYEWRGAVNALENAPGGDNRTFLTQSFRFGPDIAEVANALLERCEAELRLVGTPSLPSVVSACVTPTAFLTRTNAVGVKKVLDEQAAGGHPLLLGGGTDVLAFARGAEELMVRGSTNYPDLACFDSWQQVQEYCVVPETKILSSDLSYMRADTIEEGDNLVAFDEVVGSGNSGRKYRTATVESVNWLTRPCRRIWTHDGRAVTASVDHRWLVKSGLSSRWKTTEFLRPGDEIVSLGAPWAAEDSRDAGWLAGILDGEGCVGRGGISVAQKPGAVMDRIQWALKERGFDFSVGDKSDGVQQLLVTGGLSEHLRLLATLRPERLVAKARILWEGVRMTTTGRAVVKGVEDVGERDVLAIATDAKTFIAEGMASHNCRMDPQGDELALNVKLVEEYGVKTIIDALGKMPKREEDATLIVSTAHKAKGREWDHVKLASDFKLPDNADSVDSLSVAEWRLLYVACTRAKLTLDPFAAQPVAMLLGVAGEEEGPALTVVK